MTNNDDIYMTSYVVVIKELNEAKALRMAADYIETVPAFKITYWSAKSEYNSKTKKWEPIGFSLSIGRKTEDVLDDDSI